MKSLTNPKAKPGERRRRRRFTLTGSPLAVMRPAPAGPGRLLRISDDAAEILYGQLNCAPESETRELDILVPGFTRGIYLEKVPVETVSDAPAGPPPAGGNGQAPWLRKRVVAFRRLSPDQTAQLKSLILSYAR
jgi:hypothetical protein